MTTVFRRNYLFLSSVAEPAVILAGAGSSVTDPDPKGSAFKKASRIHADSDPDPDPGGKKA